MTTRFQHVVNQQRWDVAVVQLDALRRNIPRLATEERVAEYHAIVQVLQVESRDESIVSFRIPEREMKRSVVAARRATRRHPGHVTYSSDKYCDVHYFKRQVEGLWQYIQHRSRPEGRNMDKENDYWSLSDGELEQLASRINVPPASKTPSGEWYIDRGRIIDALLKRDKALWENRRQPSHVVHVNGDVYGSSIQQGTSASNVTINFESIEPDVRNLLANIRNSIEQIDLTDTAKQQLSADVATIDAQLDSPHPKPSIITECLRSARSILEGAAGGAIASGIAFEIAKLLAH